MRSASKDRHSLHGLNFDRGQWGRTKQTKNQVWSRPTDFPNHVPDGTDFENSGPDRTDYGPDLGPDQTDQKLIMGHTNQTKNWVWARLNRQKIGYWKDRTGPK